MVKVFRTEEHVHHVRNRSGIPLRNIAVKVFALVKSLLHVRDLRSVPVRHDAVARARGKLVAIASDWILFQTLGDGRVQSFVGELHQVVLVHLRFRFFGSFFLLVLGHQRFHRYLVFFFFFLVLFGFFLGGILFLLFDFTFARGERDARFHRPSLFVFANKVRLESRGAVKHVVLLVLRRFTLPIGQVLRKLKRVVEHFLHVRDVRSIPFREISVEVPLLVEELFHVCDVRNIPIRHLAVTGLFAILGAFAVHGGFLQTLTDGVANFVFLQILVTVFIERVVLVLLTVFDVKDFRFQRLNFAIKFRLHGFEQFKLRAITTLLFVRIRGRRGRGRRR
mmetsp:Transcript_824/g.2967  ORF Transcript_824/g.2967 Transcript_824/m.2967 type:complete len:336 (-) Transcript_824:1726-2733(-)